MRRCCSCPKNSDGPDCGTSGDAQVSPLFLCPGMSLPSSFHGSIKGVRRVLSAGLRDAWDAAWDSVRHFFCRRFLAVVPHHRLRLLAAGSPCFLSSGRFGMLPHLRGRRRCAGRRAAEDGKTGTDRDDCPRWRQSGRGQATEIQTMLSVRQPYRRGKVLCLSAASAPCFQTPLSSDQTVREAVAASRC